MPFCHLLIFFSLIFLKNLSGTPSVSNCLDLDKAQRLSGLILFHIVCKECQQMAKVKEFIKLPGPQLLLSDKPEQAINIMYQKKWQIKKRTYLYLLHGKV